MTTKQQLKDSERCLNRPLRLFHIKATVKLHMQQKILSSINTWTLPVTLQQLNYVPSELCHPLQSWPIDSGNIIIPCVKWSCLAASND
jgi:hypothetical protein